ncbi:MAG TPA: TRAM domain-containing protein [Gemmatimonadales bacterium]|nr:TRAM domain-containing protein [Gemmatimonadales bacterium]
MDEVVSVSGIATGGDGVGRLADGRAVFVPRTAPGERVRLRPQSVRMHKRYARGEVAEIVAAAATRVVAPCPHYDSDRCAGCQLQHLAYTAQLDAKRDIVLDTLRRIGKIAVPEPTVVAASQQWRYRTRIALTRTAGRSTGFGFARYDRAEAVFRLVDCHITDERLVVLWHALEGHLDLLPESTLRLTLRLDREGARHVIVESSGEPWRTADRLRDALQDGASVICWWHPVDGAARIVAGPATGFPPVGFEADHPAMDRLVRDAAVECLGAVQGNVVWDLYGGIGDTAARLAAREASVVSVDSDEQAVGWARRRPELASRGDRVRIVAGRVEDVLPGLPDPQAVVVRPPPAGLHWDVALRLTSDPVARLVYVARDPATLARDLHRMSVNYELRALHVFDAGPQTAQVETLAHLERVG